MIVTPVTKIQPEYVKTKKSYRIVGNAWKFIGANEPTHSVQEFRQQASSAVT